MKKGIRGHDVQAQGLKNISLRCKEVGIDFLQLVLEKSIENYEYGQFSEEYAISLKEELAGTKIAVLGSYINPSEPDEILLSTYINKFLEKIQYASILKPLVIGTETGTYIEGKTHSEEAYQHLLATIKILVAEAEKYNVTIGIEGVHCFVINTPEIMARLMQDIHSDHIKVIFDPCNLITVENYNKQDEMINTIFDLLANKIAVIHAKDFIVENNEIKSAHPGKGLLNYKLIFNKMKEYKLDIPVICEEINEIEAAMAFERLKQY
ncbi:MAG: sugar phosphate isomerase/epimerase [Clostridia bacterium]|nr:sugar phosphate isomerase/epimerase [Clostridia bacterium]